MENDRAMARKILEDLYVAATEATFVHMSKFTSVLVQKSEHGAMKGLLKYKPLRRTKVCFKAII